MEAALKLVLNKLRGQYLLSVSVLLLLGVLSYFLPQQQDLLLTQELSLPFQSFCILLFLIGVPFSLRWFHHKARAIRQEMLLELRLAAYFKAARLRMISFSIIALFALFLQVFTTMPNALMFFLMTMLFFLFCIPMKGQIIKDLELFPDANQEPSINNESTKASKEDPTSTTETTMHD